jgi:hypothetical protein
MGIAWGLLGALIGGSVEFLANLPWFQGLNTVDMWIPLFAIPGFLSGVIFSAVLRLAAGRRKFSELSIPWFAALGGVAGLLLGGWGLANGLGGSVGDPILRGAMVLGATTLFSTTAAAGTLALGRRGEDRTLDAIDVGDEPPNHLPPT